MKKETEQIRDDFLTSVRELVAHWNETPRTSEQKLKGLAISILSILDGEGTTLPGFSLISDGTNEDIAGNLHAMLYK